MRATTWALGAEGFSALAAGATSALQLLLDYQVTVGVTHLARYTVTRIVGSVYFRADAVPASDVVQESAFGIGVFDVNLPGTSHPNPRNENAQWMWQKTVRWVPWTIEASAGVFRQLIMEIPFEIATQRIVRGTETRLMFVTSNVIGEALSADVRTRTLLRLP